MQLKNNLDANVQLHYPVKKNGVADVEYIHIPGGATVEIDDDIFALLCKPLTRVELHEEVSEVLESEVPVKLDKNQVKIKQFIPTGKFREVNLLKQRIKDGEFTVVERPAVSEEAIDKFLTAQKIDISKMSVEDKQSLFNKLA